MRHRLLHHRALIAVVAVAGALASPGAASARAGAAEVTVTSPGGAERTLALGALAGSEDVVERSYLLRGPAGESTQALTGFSLAALLEAAGADPYGFSYLEVRRPAGGSILLSRHQALDPGAFADGPPLVYATAAGAGFLRPSAGGGDLNADESFEVPQGIAIVLRKDAALRVRAKATPLRAEPGKPVEFAAIVERAGSGESLAYSWYFDDGHSAGGETARHSFAKPGSYDVVLGVTAGGEGAGASAVVSVQVGKPAPGPDRKGGGRNDARGAPDHGAAEGPTGGSAAGGGAPTSAAPPAAKSGDAKPAQPASPTDPNPARFETDARRPKGTAEPGGPGSAGGDRVSGEVLSVTARSQPPAGAQSPAAARRGQLAGSDGGGVPAAAWGVLATLGLLGAGALLETRGLGAVPRPRLSRKGTA